MTHCRGTDFDESFEGSQPSQWYVKKDGVPIDATSSQVGGKVRIQIAGGVLETGDLLTIYNNEDQVVATYQLTDC